MSNNFSEISSESEYVQWFKISQSLLKTEEDIIFGTVYVPPENTKYFSVDIYDMFCLEVEQFVINNKYVILVADFNARTSTSLMFLVSMKIYLIF